ncbi:MAG TPA: hypothetical protein VI279_07075, partial [Rhodocyclaceae bacterium]
MTKQVASRWTRKRFLEEVAGRAQTDWGIPSDQVRVLERVIRNWLLGSPPLPAVKLRMKGKQYQVALDQLESRQVITARNDSIYTPTFYGLAIANAQEVQGVRQITAACQTIFAAARRMFKRSPTNASLPYDDFVRGI